MAKKPHGPDAIVNATIDAALALAAERGWRGLALADIAGRAGVPLVDVVEHFPSRAAILDAYAQRVDRHMMEAPVDPAESARDRLFDVIMRRFDAMAGDRRSLSAILRQCAGDPWSMLCGGRRFLRSMALILETAGISSAGLSGMAKTQGVAAIYLYTFKTFLDDDSTDHARTMAALDKGLRRAGDWIALAFRHREAPRTTSHTSQK